MIIINGYLPRFVIFFDGIFIAVHGEETDLVVRPTIHPPSQLIVSNHTQHYTIVDF